MIESVGEPARANREKWEPSSEESRREVRQVGEGYAECLAHRSGGCAEFIKSRTHRRELGLDDEMLRAKDTFLSASEEPPGSRRRASRAPTS